MVGGRRPNDLRCGIAPGLDLREFFRQRFLCDFGIEGGLRPQPVVAGMFLRTHQRRKYGKDHYYFSVLENRRIGGGRTVQRQVLYLGEVNITQEAAWRQTRQVFDEQRERPLSLLLFPDSQAVPADALHAVRVKLCG